METFWENEKNLTNTALDNKMPVSIKHFCEKNKSKNTKTILSKKSSTKGLSISREKIESSFVFHSFIFTRHKGSHKLLRIRTIRKKANNAFRLQRWTSRSILFRIRKFFVNYMYTFIFLQCTFVPVKPKQILRCTNSLQVYLWLLKLAQSMNGKCII